MPGLHPEDVLVSTGGTEGPAIACEHYAGDARKLLKALNLQAARGHDFDVTIDLEDGAPAGAEADSVREMIAVANQSESAPQIGCRLHPFDHPAFADDLHALAQGLEPSLAYLTIPKVTGVSDAASAIAHAAQSFASAGRSLPPIQLLVETHGAVRQAFELAALPEVRFLSFGQMDFTSAHHGAVSAEAMRSPGQFTHPLLHRAKVEILAACHAAGKTPTHNPTVDFANSEQTRADARQARYMGFLRMWSIHPGQIAPILEAFAPEIAEIEAAADLLLAAQDKNWGPIAFGGKLHDRASYRYFWTLLKRARAMRRALPARAEAAFF